MISKMLKQKKGWLPPSFRFLVCIEIEMLEHVDLVDDQQITGLIHQRVLERLIMALRNRQYGHVSDSACVGSRFMIHKKNVRMVDPCPDVICKYSSYSCHVS